MLHVIQGSRRSGKSTRLIERLDKCTGSLRDVLVLTYSGDYFNRAFKKPRFLPRGIRRFIPKKWVYTKLDETLYIEEARSGLVPEAREALERIETAQLVIIDHVEFTNHDFFLWFHEHYPCVETWVTVGYGPLTASIVDIADTHEILERRPDDSVSRFATIYHEELMLEDAT